VIVLDTHALLWAVTSDRKLGVRSRRLIERSWTSAQVFASALSFWELAMLQERERITLPCPVAQWRVMRMESGLVEIPVDGAIALRAAGLGGLPGDPMDRMIAATALERNATLLTADERLLAWKSSLMRHDARL
jgi:PIN domain nuclease of toxin-antitoxin system